MVELFNLISSVNAFNDAVMTWFDSDVLHIFALKGVPNIIIAGSHCDEIAGQVSPPPHNGRQFGMHIILVCLKESAHMQA